MDERAPGKKEGGMCSQAVRVLKRGNGLDGAGGRRIQGNGQCAVGWVKRRGGERRVKEQRISSGGMGSSREKSDGEGGERCRGRVGGGVMPTVASRSSEPLVDCCVSKKTLAGALGATNLANLLQSTQSPSNKITAWSPMAFW